MIKLAGGGGGSDGAPPHQTRMVPRLVATSATIIPCGGNASPKPLSIPVKSNQSTDEGMSLIVQLGTTNVGWV